MDEDVNQNPGRSIIIGLLVFNYIRNLALQDEA